MHQESVITSVRNWLEKIVIDLNLCPFARREYLNHRVRFVVSSNEAEKTSAQPSSIQPAFTQTVSVEHVDAQEFFSDRPRSQQECVQPHAQKEYIQKSVLRDLVVELALLNKRPDIETSLLILPDKLLDFDDYVQFLDFADEVLLQMNLDGVFQIASFHPDYQFADSQPDDVENYTNRSPYPILHILRESSVEAAVSAHPNTEQIPVRNKQCMRDMGLVRMRKRLSDCYQAL